MTKRGPWWITLLLLAAWPLLSMNGSVAAEEGGKPKAAVAKAKSAAKTPEKHPSREFLHFGNMGGLLPTLDRDDLPEPKSEAAEWLFTYCSQCHNAPGPGLHTAKEWETLFWRMYWRMVVMENHFPNVKLPKYGEAEAMLGYLRRYALKTMPSTAVDPEKPGAKDFLRICGQCHSYPDPSAYADHDWAFTVKRMKRHMKSMGKEIPDESVAERIEGFLKIQSKVIR